MAIITESDGAAWTSLYNAWIAETKPRSIYHSDTQYDVVIKTDQSVEFHSKTHLDYVNTSSLSVGG